MDVGLLYDALVDWIVLSFCPAIVGPVTCWLLLKVYITFFNGGANCYN